MNKDTPETDEAERESIAAYIEAYGPDALFPCDGYDHARKLECERNQWKAEAERWRDMYMQFDFMLESDIKDATEKVSDIIAQVEKLSKEIDKGY